MNSAGDHLTVARNRARQTEWYGEPLGDRFRRLLGRLGLSQAGLAGVLGLSAPMLSQLMSGQRAKISNPAVLTRLFHLERLATDPEFLGQPRERRQALLERVRATQSTTSTVELSGAPAPAQVADSVGALLQAAVPAAELEAAARLLEVDHPAVAEVLRVYGLGSGAEARAHAARVLGGPSHART